MTTGTPGPKLTPDETAALASIRSLLSKHERETLDALIDTIIATRAEFAHEARRLRQILDVLARTGMGAGALVEYYFEPKKHYGGVVVCRADRDESALCDDIHAAVTNLANSHGMVTHGAEWTKRGTERGKAEAPTPLEEARAEVARLKTENDQMRERLAARDKLVTELQAMARVGMEPDGDCG